MSKNWFLTCSIWSPASSLPSRAITPSRYTSWITILMSGVSFPPTTLIPSSTYGFERWTSMVVISPSGREGSFTQPDGQTSHFNGHERPNVKNNWKLGVTAFWISEGGVVPSSADRGGDSGQSQPEDVELTERRRWMQGLLRGLFTLGTTHSNPTTPGGRKTQPSP